MIRRESIRREFESIGDEAERKEANTLMLGGLGLGAIGVLGAVVGAAVCPVCIVAAPTMLGLGAYRRWRTAKRSDGASRGSRRTEGGG